jgi:hypothetical protein
MRYIGIFLIIALAGCGNKQDNSGSAVVTSSAQQAQQRATVFQFRYQDSPPIMEWTAPTGSHGPQVIELCHRARCVQQLSVDCPPGTVRNCAVSTRHYNLDVSDDGLVKTYRIELCGHDELGVSREQYVRLKSSDRDYLLGVRAFDFAPKCRR